MQNKPNKKAHLEYILKREKLKNRECKEKECKDSMSRVINSGPG